MLIKKNCLLPGATLHIEDNDNNDKFFNDFFNSEINLLLLGRFVVVVLYVFKYMYAVYAQ